MKGKNIEEEAEEVLEKKVDVVVVGGGIMGCFGAFYLAKSGKEVVLFERNQAVGIEGSGVNAGSLSIQNKPFPITHLALAAAKMWETLSDEVGYDLEYHRVGGLRVAETDEEVVKLHDIAKRQKNYGLNVHEISGDEARKIAPYISSTIKRANYCELDGHTDALKVVRLVAKAASEKGSKIITNTAVLELSPRRNGGFYVKTNQGVIEAGQVLITAGVWSKFVTQSLGVDLPIVLRINQMMVTDQMPPLLHHMITHVNGNLTLKQLTVGTIVVGGGWQGQGDLATNKKAPSYESMLGNAAIAIRVIPALGSLPIIRSWAGFDGRTVDQVPIMGQVPGFPDAYLATSCFGGYTIGPLLGKLIAEKMCTGYCSISVDEFNVSRYNQVIESVAF